MGFLCSRLRFAAAPYKRACEVGADLARWRSRKAGGALSIFSGGRVTRLPFGATVEASVTPSIIAPKRAKGEGARGGGRARPGNDERRQALVL